jgi:hypothetical protein
MWSGLALLIPLACLLFLGLRPGEAVPPTGPCHCGKPILRVYYPGQDGYPAFTSGELMIDGLSLGCTPAASGTFDLWSRSEMNPAETGYACAECRRSWVLNLELHGLPRNSSFLWRVRGGLLRLL